ncbi:MAG: MotA/TolQ/ExbB proton channel family protein, partial [Hydrogenimonas sp.]|nr:MotA/TolQ/ExbB proton channel family protein [Hydrogenimonas sp.]
IATTATLFGLLGTVVGVLMAFEAIGKVGMGDPSVFANGISMALVTTVGGLIVAIIHTIGYNYLIAYLDDIEASLEEDLLMRFYGSQR